MEYSLPKYTNCGYYRIFFHLHDYLLIMRDSRKENDILYEKWCKYTQDLCILRFVNSNKKKHKKKSTLLMLYMLKWLGVKLLMSATYLEKHQKIRQIDE